MEDLRGYVLDISGDARGNGVAKVAARRRTSSDTAIKGSLGSREGGGREKTSRNRY